MSTQVQFRRGTNSQHSSFTGAEGEVTVNTTNDSLHVHDGTTAGGFESARANLSNVSLSGDATNSNAAVTLATVNSNVGTFGDGGAIPSITVNGKGLITGVTTSSLGNAATATTLQTSRTIDLSGDVSGSTSFDGSANVTITATVADDSHNHVISNVDGLQDALDLKAPLASPTLSGTPTAPTAAAGTNTTQVATTAFVSTAVANVIDSAPGALDTLNELAAALGDDASFSTTVTNSIATKLPLAGGQMTGNITFSSTQTVDGRDLSVDGAKLDGIESGATADQTASEILTAIKTVDGSGTGLDADLLDGQEGSYYRNASNINSGTIGDAYLPASISSDITGNAATATAATRITLTDQSADTSCSVIFCQSATGDQLPHTGSNLTFNSANGTLSATTFSGSGASLTSIPNSATTATSSNTASTIVARDGSGNFTAGTVTATNFNSTSDIVRKKNLREVVNSLEILKDIRGVKFDWIENGSPSVGVIAQEVEQVLPELVNENDGIKSVNYNGLVGVLIEAVKELQAEVEELKKTR